MTHDSIDILLVEDNRDDAGLVIRAFRKNELLNPLLHFTDGEEALEYLFGEGRYDQRDVRQQPKVVILDLKMPKVDGLEILKRIKSDERTREIPVVMLSSSNQNSDIQRCYRSGANSYIVKPVEFEGFVKAIATMGAYWLKLNQYLQQEDF